MVRGLYQTPVFRLAGDRGLLMEFGDAIDPGINRRIRAMAAALDTAPVQGIVEVIPTYCSIIVIYDPCLTDPATLTPLLSAINQGLSERKLPTPATVELPVCYDNTLAPDLGAVARFHNLSPQAVIDIHSAPLYPIYMIGFTPGFPYLGGLSQQLHTPRRDSPRQRVSAGSVGIANDQTGIYPIESPGGWQLIGRCPIKLFDPDRETPILLKAGDLLKFRPIDLETFQEIERREG